jgi:hypothetical protein
VRLGVYFDAAGIPGGLLGQATITAPKAGAWNSVALAGISIRAGTTYWLVVLQPTGSSGMIRFRDQGSGSPSQTSSQTTLAALPATWSLGVTWFSGSMSAYLTQ